MLSEISKPDVDIERNRAQKIRSLYSSLAERWREETVVCSNDLVLTKDADGGGIWTSEYPSHELDLVRNMEIAEVKKLVGITTVERFVMRAA